MWRAGLFEEGGLTSEQLVVLRGHFLGRLINGRACRSDAFLPCFGPFPHCGDHEPPYPCDNWHFFMCTGVCHCLAFVAPQAQPTVCYRIYNVYLLSDTDPGRGGEEELSMEFYERDSRKPRPCLMFNNYRCRGVRREPSKRFVHAMVGADCFFYRSPPTKKKKETRSNSCISTTLPRSSVYDSKSSGPIVLCTVFFFSLLPGHYSQQTPFLFFFFLAGKCSCC